MGDILDVPLVSPFSASIRLFDGNGIALPNARFQASVSGVVIVDGFTSSASTKGVHYVVDADGHVVKLGRDDEFMSQTGRSAWRTDTDITKRSIGIEHVQYTRNNGVLSEKQLAASVDLVSQLMFELSIPRRNVVAHADIRCVTATDDPNNARPIIQARLALGGHVLNPFDRKGCPGYQFPWAAYEEAGAALAPAEADGQNYGFFATNAGPMTPGLRHPDVLQAKQDLREIGWVFAPGNLDDRFDSIMVTVVRRFKARFASHLGLAVDISSFPPPEVDRATGELIKRVLRAATSPANG